MRGRLLCADVRSQFSMRCGYPCEVQGRTATIDSPTFLRRPSGAQEIIYDIDPALTCWAKFFGSPPGFGFNDAEANFGGQPEMAVPHYAWASSCSRRSAS